MLITDRSRDIIKTVNTLRVNGSFTYLSAILSMIIIPVYNWYFPPVMILWIISWIFENYDKEVFKKKIDPGYRTLFILFILLYFWQVIGLSYSNDSKNGEEFVIMRLPLLFFPFILLNKGEKLRKNYKLLLKIFAISTLVYLIFCYCFALYRSLSMIDGLTVFKPYPENRYWENYFYTSNLTVKVHPTYFSLYTIISLFIALESVFDNILKKSVRIIWTLIAIFFLISLYFLSSRTAILALILILPVYLFLKMKGKRNFLVIISCILIIVALISTIAITNYRISNSVQKVSKSPLNEILIQNDRGYIWNSSLEIIRNNFVLGVGTGDVKFELSKELNKSGTNLMSGKIYDAHNQYLEILIEGGIIGLLLLSGILIWMLLIAIKRNNLIFLIFIMTCIVFFIFESMLNRLAGLSYFSLFSFLLINSSENSNSVINTEI
jgi:O-antigen ligase